MFSPLHIRDLMQDSNNIRHPTKLLDLLLMNQYILVVVAYGQNGFFVS